MNINHIKENALILLIKEYQIFQRMFASELCAEQLAVKANYYEDVRDMKNLSTQSLKSFKIYPFNHTIWDRGNKYIRYKG